MEIVSDCLGALKRVMYLPSIGSLHSAASNILKTILVHYRSLSFTRYYLHIKAHQDNEDSYSKLSRKAQLNCICDHVAKLWISADGMEATTQCKMFPLEPIGLFIGGKKMTPETGDHI